MNEKKLITLLVRKLGLDRKDALALEKYISDKRVARAKKEIEK